MKRIEPLAIRPRRIRDETQHRESAHRLAAAGLAHHRHRLTLLDGVRDAVHRLDDAGGRVELRHEVADLEERHVPSLPERL